MNQLCLTKVRALAPDVVSLIDEFLGGFAFYKLTLDSSPPSSLQVSMAALLRSNMQSNPKRIGRCVLMLLMDDPIFNTPQILAVSEITKNVGLPISDEVFHVCRRFALVEFVNKAKSFDTAMYASVLAGYLSHVTRTKVHVEAVDTSSP